MANNTLSWPEGPNPYALLFNHPDAIAQTYSVIRGHIRRTPVLMSIRQTSVSGGRSDFKLELVQHAGSFKTASAFTNLLTRSLPIAGVVAASGGNHGVAVAFAARKLGFPAKISCPRSPRTPSHRRLRECGASLEISRQPL